jgi:hypothetical protein
MAGVDARRALGIVAFMVFVALIAWFVWVQEETKSTIGMFPYKWGNALQVAHPEYQVSFEGSVRQSFFGVSMTLEMESHSVATDRNPARAVEVSQDLLGRVTFSEMPRDRLTSYLREFGGGRGADSQAKQRAVREARSLGSDEWAAVLVELTAPISESELVSLTPFDPPQWKRFFLSGPQPASRKPIYWWPGKGRCNAVYLVDPQCDDPSAVSQFRKWVDHLQDEDRDNLAKLGLDLQELRAAASRGRVYGFIANAFNRRQILDLLSLPEIRTIHIVDRGPYDE